MIIAHGIDLVDCPRIEQMLERHGERFLERVFTEKEQAYANANKNRIEKLAGRFAVKEAVLKLLGTGWRGKIAWTDIEVTRDHAGRPGILLHNVAAATASRRGITSWLISLSHTEQHAIASVIGLGPLAVP